jgi:hypothetical protein
MSNIITAGNATNNGTSISSDTSGVLELKTGSTPTTALTISTGQVVTVVNPIQGGTITSGTAVASTSGTSIDFTGIPSWVKRITIMLNRVSTTGTVPLLYQLGTSSGIVTTGYVSTGSYQGGAQSAQSSASGLLNGAGGAIADTSVGITTICNFGGNTWVSSSISGDGTADYTKIGGGSITLGGTLDRVRITTTTGSPTFDSGSVNILYE